MEHNSYVTIKKALGLLFLSSLLTYPVYFDNFDESLLDQIYKNTIAKT